MNNTARWEGGRKKRNAQVFLSNSSQRHAPHDARRQAGDSERRVLRQVAPVRCLLCRARTRRSAEMVAPPSCPEEKMVAAFQGCPPRVLYAVCSRSWHPFDRIAMCLLPLFSSLNSWNSAGPSRTCIAIERTPYHEFQQLGSLLLGPSVRLIETTCSRDELRKVGVETEPANVCINAGLNHASLTYCRKWPTRPELDFSRCSGRILRMPRPPFNACMRP